MTDKKKQRIPRLVSPAGRFRFPHLTTPDTKWKEAGEYKVDLVLDDQAAEAFIAKLQPLYDDALAKAAAEFDGLKPVAKAKFKAQGIDGPKPVPFYEPELDRETGEPTGNIVFKFRSNTKGRSVTNGKEESYDIRIAMFDAKGNKMPGVAVWGGTVGKVSFVPIPYFIPATAMCGLRMRLSGVQIIDLKTGGGSGGADAYGFGVEDGYEAHEEGEHQAPEADGFDEF